jgi:hypothetical protein
LLIDDIVTCGSTIIEVNRVIKSVLRSCKLFFFTIGKTFDSWKDENANNYSILDEFSNLQLKKGENACIIKMQ